MRALHVYYRVALFPGPIPSIFSKELFNLPTLHVVLKARHLSGSAFWLIDIGLPEQAVGEFPLGLGLVVEDRPSCSTLKCRRLKRSGSLGTRLI